MSSPSNFAAPEVKFNKLDDLPGKGKGKAYSPAEIMKAMKVLHKMIHAQAKAYGGKHSKLLAAGIAEGSLLQSVANTELVEDDTVDQAMDEAYTAIEQLQELGTDEDALLALITSLTKAIAKPE